MGAPVHLGWDGSAHAPDPTGWLTAVWRFCTLHRWCLSRNNHDHVTNKSGKDLLQLCRNLGLYIVNGRMKARETQQQQQQQGLFTDSYCSVCSAQLISQSQRLAHYQSRKHANKVRLYYMLHPQDGGCPAKKLRTDSGSEDTDVDRNKCCTLCNMSFTSAVVAESHYQGKIHAKRLKLLLGDSAVPDTVTKTPSSPTDETVVPSPWQQEDSDRFCQLCSAWFNDAGMAWQHYHGKKHRRNAGRADLIERLRQTLGIGKTKGLKRSHTCEVCRVTLNSVAQYHAHLQGFKHQNNLKNQL